MGFGQIQQTSVLLSGLRPTKTVDKKEASGSVLSVKDEYTRGKDILPLPDQPNQTIPIPATEEDKIAASMLKLFQHDGEPEDRAGKNRGGLGAIISFFSRKPNTYRTCTEALRDAKAKPKTATEAGDPQEAVSQGMYRVGSELADWFEGFTGRELNLDRMRDWLGNQNGSDDADEGDHEDKTKGYVVIDGVMYVTGERLRKMAEQYQPSAETIFNASDRRDSIGLMLSRGDNLLGNIGINWIGNDSEKVKTELTGLWAGNSDTRLKLNAGIALRSILADPVKKEEYLEKYIKNKKINLSEQGLLGTDRATFKKLLEDDDFRGQLLLTYNQQYLKELREANDVKVKANLNDPLLCVKYMETFLLDYIQGTKDATKKIVPTLSTKDITNELIETEYTERNKAPAAPAENPLKTAQK
ncbi:MAG: hypothetical protein PHH14_07160 [Candidatus Margulisbacteria bacterium]|nr:hypothetical protein [Candidatus Margulisiibacteriota bacterium]